MCVCVPAGSLPLFLALPTSSLIGLQRGRGLAGGWPADHGNDPSLPPPQTLWEATVHHQVIPPCLCSSPSSWEATLAWPPPCWCPSFAFLCLILLPLGVDCAHQSPPRTQRIFFFFLQSVVWVHLIKLFAVLMMAARQTHLFFPWPHDLETLSYSSPLPSFSTSQIISSWKCLHGYSGFSHALLI